MFIRSLRFFPALCLAAMVWHTPVYAADAVLFDGHGVADIIHDDGKPVSIASAMLANDLLKVTGAKPAQGHTLKRCKKICIVIGEQASPLMQAVARDSDIDLAPLVGQWERYVRVLTRSRSDPSKYYLVIAGSDTRGAIWGAVDLTRDLGVSAWEWWADISPRKASHVVVDGTRKLSNSPSVRYRGIFLNDEDWGLQPWAAKTYEPETGDIGPKTYAKIFELMWRLKANLIWPAMHDSTKPFYQIAGNPETARDYAIVVGTSHAEPMMRNNVREWDEEKLGSFNFFTNREKMIQYWRDRVAEVDPFENIYTVGLRGKHDSEMEGAKSPEVARDTVAEVINIQRDLLAHAQKRPAEQVPQALTLYKEVLDLYSLGLKVPGDVTLVWPEDNYGYISQLSTAAERARSGGSGVYYHISYWGRPHDYLWLATTHPALLREQMDRARQTDARRIWMLNVGDIKPGEFLTQYFLDLAFDHSFFDRTARQYLETWAASQFDKATAAEISDILTDYYDLAFERRPEFMGFSQVEPITPIRIGDYVKNGGSEAYARLDRYADLKARAEKLANKIPADRQDAYFQLVLYPVRGAASLNERNLKLDLAALYSRQGRPVANRLTMEAEAAHVRIVADTAAYNGQLGGKWNGIMNMAPRGLPVFAKPAFPTARFAVQSACNIEDGDLVFVKGRPASHALTIYSLGTVLDWRLSGQTGVSASLSQGRLEQGNGFQQRVIVHYDGKSPAEFGMLECRGKAQRIAGKIIEGEGGPVEIGRTISLSAAQPSALNSDWEIVEGLGSRQVSLRAKLSLASRPSAEGVQPLSYSFQTADRTDVTFRVVALPTHPLTSADHLRLAVQVDDKPLEILDFETHGRSEEWKLNVLSNMAQRRFSVSQLPNGRHHLKVYALDPGFILDRIDVQLNGAVEPYGAPPVS